MSRSLENRVAAVIAAAGRSRRMGTPKQLLPWGERTVMATVVDNLNEAGVTPVVCVIGHRADEMQEALRGTDARLVVNPRYIDQEMLVSYQIGIEWLLEESLSAVAGTLLALVDQPHVGSDIIGEIVAQALATPDNIVIPSHANRRGHPIYLPRRLWTEMLSLGENESLRNLLNNNAHSIAYVNFESDLVLRDMDTPDEYERLRPSILT